MILCLMHYLWNRILTISIEYWCRKQFGAIQVIWLYYVLHRFFLIISLVIILLLGKSTIELILRIWMLWAVNIVRNFFTSEWIQVNGFEDWKIMWSVFQNSYLLYFILFFWLLNIVKITLYYTCLLLTHECLKCIEIYFSVNKR